MRTGAHKLCLGWASLLVLLSVSRAGGNDGVPGSSQDGLALQSIELEDQHGQAYSRSFPSVRPVVLLCADRKGARMLGPWIEALRESVGAQAEILGIADLREVPGLLRGKVRRKFKKDESHPILLDWRGDVLGRLEPRERVPNVFLIGTNGCVHLHVSGEPGEAPFDELRARLEEGRGASLDQDNGPVELENAAADVAVEPTGKVESET